MSSLVQEIKHKWKPRSLDSHKGDYGRILILAGSKGFTGAAHLCAQGALRTGAGLITLGVPEKVYSILAKKESEVMVHGFPSTREGSFSYKSWKEIQRWLKTQNILVLGPGMGRHHETDRLIQKVTLESNIPIVLDADGLNAFQGRAVLLKACRGRAILTPHPGEFERLFRRHLSTAIKVRKKLALEAAERLGVFIVLKGYRTVVASPDGECSINSTGNPGMASGGTGDVLTGIIAGLLGQKFSLWDSARFGAFLHGLVGDIAVRQIGEASLTAGDLLENLPVAIRKLRGR